MNLTHDELCRRAEKWLKNMGCKVVFNDRFQAATQSGEQPDAIGWKAGVSFLIECKTSRADYLADAKKPFRIKPERGMGDWRFYMCPKGLIKPEELPAGWGLLYVNGARVEKVHGIPTNTQYYNCPFIGEKRDETMLLVSALRRLEIRGHFNQIYDKL